MENITKLPNRIKDFLTETANRVAISSGFIKRRRKLTGGSFVQALVQLISLRSLQSGNL